MRFIRGNILGLVAIFIALSGVAVAVQKNSVKSRHIVKGGVQSSDVRDDTRRKGGLRSSDIAPDALTTTDIAEGTLFNDDSLSGADIDEGALGEVPNAARAGSAGTAETAVQAGNADTLDGIDSADLVLGNFTLKQDYFNSEAVQAGFSDVMNVPGVGVIQARCSALNPNRIVLRLRNDSPVTLDVEVRSGQVLHPSDAVNPLPPVQIEDNQVLPGQLTDEVEMLGSGNDETHMVWQVLNYQDSLATERYARFEVISSGDSNDCFASILALARR